MHFIPFSQKNNTKGIATPDDKKPKKPEFITGNSGKHGLNLSHIAGVAQLVEHLIRNEGVVGSSPIPGTRKTYPRYTSGIFVFIEFT